MSGADNLDHHPAPPRPSSSSNHAAEPKQNDKDDGLPFVQPRTYLDPNKPAKTINPLEREQIDALVSHISNSKSPILHQ